MKDVFIADAHLIDPDDENYRRLLAFLDELGGEVGTLYLLGDIFEFWVGYRHVVFARYVPLLAALARLRQAGAQIVYVEGNHDFKLGPYFRETLGCRVLPDGGDIDLDGQKVHIAHGDLINPADRSYRILRRFLRSRPLQGALRAIPPDWAWGISRWASGLSKKSRPARLDRWLPEQLLESYADRRFAEGNIAVITGHYHVPLAQKNSRGLILSLGDWITQYSYATYEDGEFCLHTYE